MKSKKIVSALVALSMATSGFAFAQGNGDRNDRNDRGRGEQTQRNDHQDRREQVRQPDRRDDRRDDGGRGNQFQVEHRDERGAGPNHEFRRGGRLPNEYRSRQYVVDDWRGHHLSAPPRGYHWVQAGGDYVLVAVATGLIMQLLLNN
jgi:Ni/Co efflux regulator RcnB